MINFIIVDLKYFNIFFWAVCSTVKRILEPRAFFLCFWADFDIPVYAKLHKTKNIILRFFFLYCESTFKIKNGQWVLAGDSTA